MKLSHLLLCCGCVCSMVGCASEAPYNPPSAGNEKYPTPEPDSEARRERFTGETTPNKKRSGED